MTAPHRVQQYTEGTDREQEHTHLPVQHSHDHYHVTHHHKDRVLGEWEHRTFWHTHDHNHNEIIHGHNYGAAQEEVEHGKEAHMHDHAAPTASPA